MNISLANSEYFFYNNGTVDYYVWFDVDGAAVDPGASDPNLDGKTGLEVDISAISTAKEVAELVKDAINGTASSATQLDAVVTVSNPSNENDTNMSDYNTTMAIAILDTTYRAKNDYPPASTLTQFRNRANGNVVTEARANPDLDAEYLADLEYRMVELMVDEEQTRETEEGRSVLIPRDYMYTRDRDKVSSSGADGFTRGRGS